MFSEVTDYNCWSLQWSCEHIQRIDRRTDTATWIKDAFILSHVLSEETGWCAALFGLLSQWIINHLRYILTLLSKMLSVSAGAGHTLDMSRHKRSYQGHTHTHTASDLWTQCTKVWNALFIFYSRSLPLYVSVSCPWSKVSHRLYSAIDLQLFNSKSVTSSGFGVWF